MAKRRAVRFAVGSPEGPRSGVWRLWASGSDVYISARLDGGTLKASLHKSVKWRWGFTEEYEETNPFFPPRADRAIHKWERPPELFEGITSAFEIIVPPTELTMPRLPLSEEAARKYTSKVHWVSPPSSEAETHFRVLFIAPDSSTPVANEVMWKHELPTGETVELIVYEQPMTEGNKKYLTSVKWWVLREVGESGKGTSLTMAPEPRGWLYGDAEDGTRFLVDISAVFLFE